MDKVRSLTKKDKVEIEKHGVLTKVSIYLNETEDVGYVYDSGENSEARKVTSYVYDTYRFADLTENLDLDDIKANPENYISKAPKSLGEKVSDTQDTMNAIVDVLAENLYGG